MTEVRAGMTDWINTYQRFGTLEIWKKDCRRRLIDQSGEVVSEYSILDAVQRKESNEKANVSQLWGVTAPGDEG